MSMLIQAIAVGFSVTGVMLYMFIRESLKLYAVMSPGWTSLTTTENGVLTGSGMRTVGCGIGTGLCAVAGCFLNESDDALVVSQ
jgi:hypothetical protein